ncbi:hypothetical protein QBC44DRAFT_356951 [Cladorrhinum sp. PSN332]|nr:hypothetical protein QBC44DRAFT_356951 [Cladorrhinum sp. PSN332]
MFRHSRLPSERGECVSKRWHPLFIHKYTADVFPRSYCGKAVVPRIDSIESGNWRPPQEAENEKEAHGRERNTTVTLALSHLLLWWGFETFLPHSTLSPKYMDNRDNAVAPKTVVADRSTYGTKQASDGPARYLRSRSASRIGENRQSKVTSFQSNTPRLQCAWCASASAQAGRWFVEIEPAARILGNAIAYAYGKLMGYRSLVGYIYGPPPPRSKFVGVTTCRVKTG